jgi:hypothetical protein
MALPEIGTLSFWDSESGLWRSIRIMRAASGLAPLARFWLCSGQAEFRQEVTLAYRNAKRVRFC